MTLKIKTWNNEGRLELVEWIFDRMELIDGCIVFSEAGNEKYYFNQHVAGVAPLEDCGYDMSVVFEIIVAYVDSGKVLNAVEMAFYNEASALKN